MSSVEEIHKQVRALRRTGDLAGAERLCRQILAGMPDHAPTLQLLAGLAARSGRVDEAITYLQQAVASDPTQAGYHSSLAELYRRAGQSTLALAHLRRAVACRADSVEAHGNLGNYLLELGQVDEAVAALETAARLRPDVMAVHYNLANALRAAGRYDAAVASYRQALRLDPSFVPAHNNLGIVLRSLGDHEAAAAAFGEMLRLAPNSAEAHHNLGLIWQQAGDFERAHDAFTRAIAIDPRYAPSHFHLGRVQLAQKQWDAARASYLAALRLRPDYAQAYCSLGILAMAQGRYDEAGRHFDAALALDPELAEAHCNRGKLLLGGGDAAAGWGEFAWFSRCDAYLGRRFAQGAWDGSPLDGRTLLVVCGESLGDTIQFVRYLPWLRQQQQGKVLLAAQKALHPILSVSGIDEVVSLDEPLQFDVHTSIMVLPALYYAQRRTTDVAVPYLHPAGELVDRWRRQLASLAGLKVGLCWQGNPAYPWDAWRSIPLAELAPLGEVAGVSLVSLQHGAGREQLADFAARYAILEAGEDVDRRAGAFMDTAAIIQNLDLVITSDTSTAHLAGALGARVWVVLSGAPEFRWMRDGESCPWYSTMRLFRQAAGGGWSGVCQRVADELRALAADTRRPAGG